MNESEKDIESIDKLLKALKPKQRMFCLFYTKHMNGARAAREAGYSVRSDDEIALENLRKPQILKVIKLLLEEKIMSTEESLVRLTNWGRGSIEPFLTVDGVLDLTSIEARENIHLIKKMKQTKKSIIDEDGEESLAQIVHTEIELHDAKDAIKTILEAQGKIVKRLEHTGANGGPIKIQDLSKMTDDELKRIVAEGESDSSETPTGKEKSD